MSDWQPIETAPKDFTAVRLKVPGYAREFEGWFDGREWIASAPLSNKLPRHYPDPTNWMPLPEPPKAAK